MTRAITITLEPHQVTEPEPAWCDTCLLPSAITVGFVIVDRNTLTHMGRFTVTVCDQCGSRA
jgi:hypothetical protein